ncbi:hypothetical protein ACI394_28720, partial [Klebsiella pneumoniae]|uniref:hypothetical protein n=1 Tax=Klebsiella pneumoniae TaxID=573 RepID=UPI003852B586
LAASLTASLAQAPPANAANPASEQGASEAKAILADLLALDTSSSHGTVNAVELLRKRFMAAGFPSADLAVVSKPDEPSQTSLVVRIHG